MVWLEQSYSSQVNASILTMKTSAHMIERQMQPANTTLAPESRDHWGRPFAHFEREGCLVLVSYGSDGIPDTDSYGTSLCDGTQKASSSCWWPTFDTVFVNGKPIKSCLK
jgi:hypothetical protein